MCQYWVDGVWRRHALVDPEAKWAAFEASPFFSFLPRMEWPLDAWTGERVQQVLGRLRSGSSPGLRGIPIALWKAFPAELHQRVAALFAQVEAHGSWPSELLEGYVALIPKASGGSRPQDQRPIAVLDVLYRLWAKGVVLTWVPSLQGLYLGPAALGFRS